MSFRYAILVGALLFAGKDAFAYSRVAVLQSRVAEKPGNEKTRLQYSYHFYGSSQDTTQTARYFGVSRHKGGIEFPLQDNAQTLVTLGPKADYYKISSNAQLGVARRAMPEEIYDLRIEMNWLHASKQGDTFGLHLEPLTASDKPFKGGTYGVESTMFYRPGTRKGAPGPWIYFLDFSTNRLILSRYPLPGFAKVFSLGANTDMMLGLPVFAVTTRFTPRVKGDLRFFPTEELTGNLTYQLDDGEWLAVSGRWSHDRYMRKDRVESVNRLVLEEKIISLALGTTIMPRMYIWATGGYAFDRQVYEGKNYWNDDYGRVSLEATVIASVKLDYLF